MSFSKQLPPKPGPACRNLGPIRLSADRLGYLTHIRPGGLTDRRNPVDRADSLGQEGVGRELAQLAAPEVGGEDSLGWHPVAVEGCQRLDRLGVLAANQHSVWGFQIGNRRALRQEFGVGEHRETKARLALACAR